MLLTLPDPVAELKDLLAKNCRIQKVQPAVYASDGEVNIVMVTLLCPDGAMHIIKAYKEQAQALREFVRTRT